MAKFICSVILLVALTFTAQAADIVLTKTGNAFLDGVYTESVALNGAPSFVKNTEGGIFRISKFKIKAEKQDLVFIGWQITDAAGREYFAATIDSPTPPAEGWDVARAGVGFNVDFELTYRSLNSAKNFALTLTNAPQSTISVFPNPTMGSITIDTQEPIQAVDVINLAGQTVLKGQNAQLDLSNLPVGTYNLLIQTAAGRSVRKIVKQ